MTHLIADEKLGGIQREYIEVARKADVGDYAIITEGHETLVYKEVGEIVKIVEADADTCDGMFRTHDIGKKGAVYHFQSRTLEPTDIVVIDGTKYRLAERKAEVGEKVFITWSHHVRFGKIVQVTSAHTDGGVYVYDKEYNTPRHYLDEGDYRVLIPVDSEPAEHSPDIYDLLANLAERVTSLERIVGELARAKTPADERLASLESRLLDTQRNVQTFAELAETTRLTKDDALHATIEALCAHIAKTGGGR